MRNISKAPETFLYKAKSIVTSIGWALRKIMGQERLEQTYPIESDEPKRYSDVAIIVLVRVTGRAICNPTQDAQQRQLIGRGFVVVEDDVPDERQRAGSVIRKS